MIIVASPPRSYSSLVCACLERAGANFGECKPGDEWNPLGYYENLVIRQAEAAYLQEHDHRNHGKQFHPMGLGGSGEGWRDIVLEQFPDPTKVNVYKSTKAPMLYNLWRREFPNARWILLHRDPGEVIRSMMRTPFMDAYHTPGGWDYLLATYENLYQRIIRDCKDAHIVDIDFNSPRPLQRVFSLCGIYEMAGPIIEDLYQKP